jgi:hypothetical protein
MGHGDERHARAVDQDQQIAAPGGERSCRPDVVAADL